MAPSLKGGLESQGLTTQNLEKLKRKINFCLFVFVFDWFFLLFSCSFRQTYRIESVFFYLFPIKFLKFGIGLYIKIEKKNHSKQCFVNRCLIKVLIEKNMQCHIWSAALFYFWLSLLNMLKAIRRARDGLLLH